MLAIFPESMCYTQITVSNTTYTVLNFKFHGIVYHAPQFKWEIIFLPFSSILLASTNICCKAVDWSLAFRFPSYRHHVQILAELVWGFEVQCMEGHPRTFGAAGFPLDSYLLLPCCLDWNSWPTSRSFSMRSCSNTSIHWSELMKCRGK